MKTESYLLESGEQVPLTIAHRRGTRNITIRPQTGPRREIHVSLPYWTPMSAARTFLEQKRKWIEKIFAAAPKKIRISDGDAITIFGRDVTIRHNPSGRAGVYWQSEDKSSKLQSQCSNNGVSNPVPGPFDRAEGASVMIVCGSTDMLERRVRDEIKKLFLTAVKRETAGVPAAFRPRSIAVRDTTSRWGSCSSSGTISFSWRLAFAPPTVMRYVIMHELAHKRHMDHSVKFWATVSELYGPGVERAKLWLSKHGQELHRYF